MADNVKVKPSESASGVDIATDEVGSVHYPVYKLAVGADGEAVLVDTNNPVPVQTTPSELAGAANAERLEVLEDILMQLKIMNVHLESITGERITCEDVS